MAAVELVSGDLLNQDVDVIDNAWNSWWLLLPQGAAICKKHKKQVIYTTIGNPIESTFATIRLRHRKTKGSGTRRTSLAMMFKLAQSAANKWRRLNCHEEMTIVIERRSFKDGIL